MSNQSLQESISALMDNEADELEIRRVLQASESDPALRSTWDRYQMARSIMHKEPWQPKVDLSAGISALIADEAVPVAVESKSPRVWQNLSRLAVAASVTLAVLVRQHAEHSSRFEAPQLLPYARAASLENQ